MTLKEIKMDRFVFTTGEKNKKHQQISENPNVAACFFWNYKDTNDRPVSRQVRIEGFTEGISREDCEKYFNSELLFHQIRYHICDQGKEVDWNQLKEKHDQILEEVKNGKELKLPELYTGYKIIPKNFDFYYSSDSATIADRIIVVRGEDKNAWKFVRVGS